MQQIPIDLTQTENNRLTVIADVERKKNIVKNDYNEAGNQYSDTNPDALADGDTFEDPLSNYGSRVWWFRELEGGPSAAWAVLDPNTLVSVDETK